MSAGDKPIECVRLLPIEDCASYSLAFYPGLIAVVFIEDDDDPSIASIDLNELVSGKLVKYVCTDNGAIEQLKKFAGKRCTVSISYDPSASAITLTKLDRKPSNLTFKLSSGSGSR